MVKTLIMSGREREILSDEETEFLIRALDLGDA